MTFQMYNCPVISINRRKIIMASIRKKRKAFVEQADCVACGCCVKVCPWKRSGSSVGSWLRWIWENASDAVVCQRMSGKCDYGPGGGNMKKQWYDYLWILSLTYLILGFFNIMFAWLGLICFFVPLLISLIKGTKGYCNRYCGRGQLFGLLGGTFGLSRKTDIPKWMKSKWFRYGFLIFFFTMFFLMLWNTYLVFSEAGT